MGFQHWKAQDNYSSANKQYYICNIGFYMASYFCEKAWFKVGIIKHAFNMIEKYLNLGVSEGWFCFLLELGNYTQR